MREVKAAGEWGVPLNKYLKQVGKRGCMVTKTSEKASRPPRDIFFVLFGKARRFTLGTEQHLQHHRGQ